MRKKMINSCYRTIIYLGDLARYKEVYSGRRSKNWIYTRFFYQMAVSLLPGIGNGYNQLAVVDTIAGNEVEAIVHYYKSLLVENPFTTSKENIAIMFSSLNKSNWKVSVSLALVELLKFHALVLGYTPLGYSSLSYQRSNDPESKTEEVLDYLKGAIVAEPRLDTKTCLLLTFAVVNSKRLIEVINPDSVFAVHIERFTRTFIVFLLDSFCKSDADDEIFGPSVVVCLNSIDRERNPGFQMIINELTRKLDNLHELPVCGSQSEILLHSVLPSHLSALEYCRSTVKEVSATFEISSINTAELERFVNEPMSTYPVESQSLIETNEDVVVYRSRSATPVKEISAHSSQRLHSSQSLGSGIMDFVPVSSPVGPIEAAGQSPASVFSASTVPRRTTLDDVMAYNWEARRLPTSISRPAKRITPVPVQMQSEPAKRLFQPQVTSKVDLLSSPALMDMVFAANRPSVHQAPTHRIGPTRRVAPTRITNLEAVRNTFMDPIFMNPAPQMAFGPSGGASLSHIAPPPGFENQVPAAFKNMPSKETLDRAESEVVPVVVGDEIGTLDFLGLNESKPSDLQSWSGPFPFGENRETSQTDLHSKTEDQVSWLA